MKIISGHTFTNAQTIDGLIDKDAAEGLLVVGNTFTGAFADEGALMIRNCADFTIRNNFFHDLDSSAIVLRSTGTNRNGKISNNKIWDVTGNGIIVKKPNFGIEIIENEIINAGDSELDHAIYMLGPDSLICGNTIKKTSGNGISIRSSGKVFDNIIDEAAKASIRYFSDGMPGDSNELIVGWNTCFSSIVDHPAISLYYSPVGALVGRYTINHNKLYSQDVFQVQSPFFGTKSVYVYGNSGRGNLHLQYVDTHYDNDFIPAMVLN